MGFKQWLIARLQREVKQAAQVAARKKSSWLLAFRKCEVGKNPHKNKNKNISPFPWNCVVQRVTILDIQVRIFIHHNKIRTR